MTRDERDVLVRALMEAFVLYGMGEQVQALQVYAAAARRGAAGLDGAWTDVAALRWAAVLRLPPWDLLLPVRRARAQCEKCGSLDVHAQVLPAGAVVTCGSCGQEWLVDP